MDVDHADFFVKKCNCWVKLDKGGPAQPYQKLKLKKYQQVYVNYELFHCQKASCTGKCISGTWKICKLNC